ncbi:MAG: saccharopine dehydrogenase family protein [Candidatus Njordarchaeia archaeon]
MKIVVLGGAGTVGGWAAQILAASGMVNELVIGDINLEGAKKMAEKLGGIATAVKVDASDKDSIKNAIKGADVVLSTVGPFYKFGPIILDAVIESGINFVDICDDYDATLKELELHQKAVDNNVSALIGMGSSPGIANVLVRFAADYLLNPAETVGIYHLHGGEEAEGPAVIKHRIHSMSSEVPVFIDGEMKKVRMFDEAGRALEEDVEYCGFGTYRSYIYPHPEIITLPRYIKTLKKVVNLGLVLPPEYFKLIMEIVRLGIIGEEPIDVGGVKIKPIDFAVSYILHQRPKMLEAAGITKPIGCLKIVVGGKENGKDVKYVFEGVSGGGMGQGTALPAAIGALYMGMGKIKEKGVLPPEACIEPMEFVKFIGEIFRKSGVGETPIRAYKIDSSGNKHEIKLPL